MTVHTITSKFCGRRAFLIIPALISLCVSGNVGPRFLPLPGVSDRIGATQGESQNNTSAPLPSPHESDHFRVPMMAQSHKRAGTEQHPQPFATPALMSGFELPDKAQAISEFCDEFPFCPSASVSRPPGRAPPRLV